MTYSISDVQFVSSFHSITNATSVLNAVVITTHIVPSTMFNRQYLTNYVGHKD